MTGNDTSTSGTERNTATCPNCGQTATDSYETGPGNIREFDCRNGNCRCEVFRAIETDTDR